ncbi:MAG: site-specific integrase [Nitrococcus sp.]|nr:site-specific integrase [Nitrococcus sp.]
MPELTQKIIATSRPKSAAYDIRDARIGGFLLRVLPSGKKRFYAQYGRGKRCLIGDAKVLTLTQARLKAKQLIGDAATGKDPMEAKRRARAKTLREYLDKVHGPWLVANRKDGRATRARLRACFDAELGGKRLGELNTWLIEKWRSARLKAGIKPATLNRDIGPLKAALNRAVEWHFIDINPIAKHKPAKTDRQGSVRFLSEDEERRLRQALDAREAQTRRARQSANQWRSARGYELFAEHGAFTDHVKPLVLLALNSGLRRGELFNLRWSGVDLERGLLTVEGGGAKSSQTRHVPLNREARETLKRWPADEAEGYVFPGALGGRLDNINKAWAGVVAAARLEHFRFHDLRHTFASKLVMAGADLYTVKELLGHSTIAMTERYAHLAPAHKAAAVALLERG